MFSFPKSDVVRLSKLAIPIIMTNCLDAVFGAIDKAIVGNISVEGFAAVGIVSNFTYLLCGTVGTISLAYNIMFAQAIKHKGKLELEKIFGTVICLTFLLGVIFELFCIFLGRSFLAHFYGISGLILEEAYRYLLFDGITVGLNIGLFLFSGYFKNLEITRVYLYSGSISMIVNLIFDYLLAFGKCGFPKLGAMGTAIGSVLGLLAGIGVNIGFFMKSRFIRFRVVMDKKILSRLLRLSCPLVGQDLVECTICGLMLSAMIARIGTEALAAYNLIETLNSFVMLPIYAYAGVSSTLLAQNYLLDSKASKRYPQAAMICSIGFFVIFYFIILFFRIPILSAIVKNEKIVLYASRLVLFAIGTQLFKIVAQEYKYCLQSIGIENWVFQYSAVVTFASCGMIYFLLWYLAKDLIFVYSGLGISYVALTIGYILKYNSFFRQKNREKAKCSR